jgi:large subunit ribosomal protein L21e
MGKSSGTRRKSRSALTKKIREKVVINIDPGIHKAMPHKRYQGKVATVVGQRGRAYILEIPQRKTVKTIITTPEHMRKHQEA